MICIPVACCLAWLLLALHNPIYCLISWILSNFNSISSFFCKAVESGNEWAPIPASQSSRQQPPDHMKPEGNNCHTRGQINILAPAPLRPPWSEGSLQWVWGASHITSDQHFQWPLLKQAGKRVRPSGSLLFMKGLLVHYSCNHSFIWVYRTCRGSLLALHKHSYIMSGCVSQVMTFSAFFFFFLPQTCLFP